MLLPWFRRLELEGNINRPWLLIGGRRLLLLLLLLLWVQILLWLLLLIWLLIWLLLLLKWLLIWLLLLLKWLLLIISRLKWLLWLLKWLLLLHQLPHRDHLHGLAILYGLPIDALGHVWPGLTLLPPELARWLCERLLLVVRHLQGWRRRDLHRSHAAGRVRAPAAEGEAEAAENAERDQC